jgi:hypothetical protein
LSFILARFNLKETFPVQQGRAKCNPFPLPGLPMIFGFNDSLRIFVWYVCGKLSVETSFILGRPKTMNTTAPTLPRNRRRQANENRIGFGEIAEIGCNPYKICTSQMNFAVCTTWRNPEVRFLSIYQLLSISPRSKVIAIVPIIG